MLPGFATRKLVPGRRSTKFVVVGGQCECPDRPRRGGVRRQLSRGQPHRLRGGVGDPRRDAGRGGRCAQEPRRRAAHVVLAGRRPAAQVGHVEVGTAAAVAANSAASPDVGLLDPRTDTSQAGRYPGIVQDRTGRGNCTLTKMLKFYLSSYFHHGRAHLGLVRRLPRTHGSGATHRYRTGPCDLIRPSWSIAAQIIAHPWPNPFPSKPGNASRARSSR